MADPPRKEQHLKNDDTLKVYALINYEDPYVQPLILSALETHLPPLSYTLVSSASEVPSASSKFLQIVQYEAIDFSHLLDHPTTCLANSYVIRKALIRKHYLANMVEQWVVKNPESVLKGHVKSSVAFEVDYAEFLEEGLAEAEAWELEESWRRNEEGEEKEWWILKPGMSERGQGIRLFSSPEELTAIFEEWDPEESDDEEEENEEAEDARSDDDEEKEKSGGDTKLENANQREGGKKNHDTSHNDGIITSQLRHFIAQPYIHPPLLLPPPHFSSSSPSQTLHKFHIRAYVLAVGALKLYIYRPMLALFASRPYVAPNAKLVNDKDKRDEALRAHLSNTCLQDEQERDGTVGLFWELPKDVGRQKLSRDQPHGKGEWKTQTFSEICSITSDLFLAAARTQSTHFQPLPNSFEIYGLDFMVGIEKGGELRTWLLEVNAFPDFRQTGSELRGLVQGLWEEVVRAAVRPFFHVDGEGIGEGEGERMVKILDVDLGRR